MDIDGKRGGTALAGAPALELDLDRRRIPEGNDHVEHQLLLRLRLDSANLRRLQIVDPALQLLRSAQVLHAEIVQRAHGRQRTQQQLLGVVGRHVAVDAAEQAAFGAQRSLHRAAHIAGGQLRHAEALARPLRLQIRAADLAQHRVQGAAVEQIDQLGQSVGTEQQAAQAREKILRAQCHPLRLLLGHRGQHTGQGHRCQRQRRCGGGRLGCGCQ